MAGFILGDLFWLHAFHSACQNGNMFRFWITILSLLLMVSAASTQETCDPNYQNPPCVPIASDVDCAGGKGNGPAYVRGPVIVIGIDIYGLDRDKDGIGCERG